MWKAAARGGRMVSALLLLLRDECYACIFIGTRRIQLATLHYWFGAGAMKAHRLIRLGVRRDGTKQHGPQTLTLCSAGARLAAIALTPDWGLIRHMCIYDMRHLQ